VEVVKKHSKNVYVMALFEEKVQLFKKKKKPANLYLQALQATFHSIAYIFFPNHMAKRFLAFGSNL